MNIPLRRYFKYYCSFLGLAAISIAALAAPPDVDKSNHEILNAMAALHHRTPELMRRQEVVGTATGLSDDGKPAILVFTKTAPAFGSIPDSLDHIPVIVRVTGKFFTMKLIATKGGKPSHGDKVDTTSSFPWPVPIGVSTGNAGECSAGTIGARIKGSNGAIYALSNNHVYALENNAAIGSSIRQPGLYDSRCGESGTSEIGTLSAFVPIDFSETASNTVDAAIAVSSTDKLGKATPANGYGTPKSSIATAALGQAVQKYGRTTVLTKGTVTGLDATIKVSYAEGTALFEHQIIVTAKRPFIKAGDSGSLLVTNTLRPIGLLFAGDGSGKYAIANPIDEVLGQLGARPEVNTSLSIDGN